MNINKTILVGRLTRAPELKALPNGNQVCSFSLATSYKYEKDGQKVEQTEFHNVVAFGKVAEVIAKWVIKGQELYVEGRLKTDTYEKDGQKHYSTKIILEKFDFGAKPKGVENNYQSDQQVKNQDEAGEENQDEEFDGEINPDDIPF